MLRESSSADRPKGSGNFSGRSGPSMCRRSFSRIVTWRKGLSDHDRVT